MKKNISILFLIPFAFFCCSQKKENIAIADKIPQNVHEKHIKKEIINDTLTVKIDKDILLKWNVRENEFVKDTNFYKYSKNNQALKKIAESILSENDLHVKICTKKTSNLKTGDIAFLYLWKNQKIYIFKCLKIQFDVINENCKIPEYLLDYIEKNRMTVHNKVIECKN
ncbi:hypothetical protein JET18_21130 [Chryseobacterium sp. L7]|uniref:Lipoprotein n=1 Tax=Chryseobacterium endalhagicum TaxID=2797638 RepID=A0ABS1QL51_9FLAO|nr:hypothetical protein [Chryseobacterium endalhagicum]MBL1223358.1 hypothetical protein [Chryseobacterium endalhagicum]